MVKKGFQYFENCGAAKAIFKTIYQRPTKYTFLAWHVRLNKPRKLKRFIWQKYVQINPNLRVNRSNADSWTEM